MKKTLNPSTFLLLLTPAFLWGQPPSPSQFERRLEKGWSTLQAETLEQLRQDLEPCADGENADFLCRYQLAETCYHLSLVYENQKKRHLGEKAMEAALKTALEAARQKKDSAEIHSLLADIYGLKIRAYGDMFTAIDCGPKIDAENKLALRLDPENAKVQAGLGRQYLMTPPQFGGNPKKAVDCFKKSLELNPKSDETLFWLSRAYRKLRDKEDFEKTLKRALRLNPGNLLIQQELKSPLK